MLKKTRKDSSSMVARLAGFTFFVSQNKGYFWSGAAELINIIRLKKPQNYRQKENIN